MRSLTYVSSPRPTSGKLPEHERTIPGYHLILPNTMASMKHAIIVLVVKNGLNVHKLTKHMDQDTATIWVKVGNVKKNSLIVGGIYREHQQLGMADRNATRQERQEQQERRWMKIIRKWTNVNRNVKCVGIGIAPEV